MSFYPKLHNYSILKYNFIDSELFKFKINIFLESASTVF